MQKKAIDFNQKTFNQNRNQISVLLGEFSLIYLRNLYQRFDGDLILAMILGEIAQHNISFFFKNGEFISEEFSLQNYLSDPDFRPCNTYSIAESTGIPRETVRRKVLKLIKLGYVSRLENQRLCITKDISEEFEGFNEEICAKLLKLMSQLDSVFSK